MVKAFGDLLRLHRAAAGLSQAGLADRAGLSEQAVGSLERGRRTRPRRHTVVSIADALGLDGVKRLELLAAASESGHRRRRGHGRAEATTRFEIEPAVTVPVVPRSLPPAVGDFTGREWQVKQLRDMFAATTVPSVVVSAIEGMGGVGKTALAIHVAHLLADQFPDGQLYLDLRGFGPGDPMTTTEALGLLLRSLGVSVTDAGGVDYAASRYRSAIAGKRMLVLFDNAADVEQVKALLPGTAGCAAIVTSRRSLSTLPGARHLQLDILPEDEAVGLLGAIAGEHRVMAEIDAAHDVVRRCAHLPLAIRMAGARLLARPCWPMSVLADELSDERRRLDVLEQQDVGVRASFAVSLRQLADSRDPLDNAAAAAFPLMGLPDGPDLSLSVVVQLLDKSETDTVRVLDRLVDSNLLETHRPRRYRLHDLLRMYAREHGDATMTNAERAEALTRVLVQYNSVAWRTHELWRPHNQRSQYMDQRWIASVPGITTKTAAPAWLDPERPHLMAVIRQCSGLPGVPKPLINQLAMGLMTYYSVRQQCADQMTVNRLAIDVAAASGDRIGEAFGHNDLSGALSELGYNVNAAAEMERAVDLFRSADDLRGEASSLCNLGYMLEKVDRLDEAVVAAQRALDLNRQLGDLHRIGQAWLILGVVSGRLGKNDEAMACIHKSRECFREIGHEAGLADAAFFIGEAHLRSGRYNAALAALNESITLYKAAALHGHLALSYSVRGAVYVAMGRYADGVNSARAALSIAVDAATPYPEAQARFVLGEALAGLGHETDARHEWERALEVYDAIGSAKAPEARALLLQR